MLVLCMVYLAVTRVQISIEWFRLFFMQEEYLMRRSRVVGFLMFTFIIIVGYLLSSLLSWNLDFVNWNVLSIICMIAASIYALIALKYNSYETKIELANAKSVDEELKPLYEEIRNKTNVASVEQKYAILQQCLKMKKIANSTRDNNLYRVSQRLEYVMSEALKITPQQSIAYFSKHKSGLDMEILSSIKSQIELRDFLVYFFNIYSYVSTNSIDIDSGKGSVDGIFELCDEIDKCFELTYEKARTIINNYVMKNP